MCHGDKDKANKFMADKKKEIKKHIAKDWKAHSTGKTTADPMGYYTMKEIKEIDRKSTL